MDFFDFLKDLFFTQTLGTPDTSVQEELEKASKSTNGVPDIGEESDILSEMDDEENFNVQGDGYKDNSSGYGRGEASAGYPNPFDRNSQ